MITKPISELKEEAYLAFADVEFTDGDKQRIVIHDVNALAFYLKSQLLSHGAPVDVVLHTYKSKNEAGIASQMATRGVDMHDPNATRYEIFDNRTHEKLH